MHRLEDLRATPNALVRHYRHARVGDRILLTGHSHQAWPDRGRRGHEQAWIDAALHLDDKWESAFAVARRVRQGFARLLDDREDAIALAPNTHELVVRFLSALPLARRSKLVTSDGEFHTIRRQLTRLGEEGLEIVRVPALPAASLAERLADTIDERTAAVLVSSVLFQNAQRVPELGQLARSCQGVGAELLVDVYHQLNAIPFSVAEAGLDTAFVVGGGYKYCQLGEGNCFLRLPQGCRMRPVITGWFSEFAKLGDLEPEDEVGYGPGGDRFAGATYDPTSHYRAADVFDFFAEEGLGADFLREVSQHQVALLARRFDDLDLAPALIRRDAALPLEQIGAFLTLQSPRAPQFCTALRDRGVLVDTRGDTLRLGPAPYLCDQQLEDGIAALAEAAAGLG